MPKLPVVLLGIALAAAALAFTAPDTVGAQTQPATAPAVDPASRVDAELRPFLAQLAPLALTRESVAASRGGMRMPALPPPAPQPQTRTILGPPDASRLELVMVDPRPLGSSDTSKRPALVHVHGGGYVLGSAAGFTPLIQRLAQECRCLVVSVEYRLAPETAFPGALEDAYAALRYVHDNADALSVDRERIAVAGESAGGGLAAQLAIAARDRGKYKVAFQMLVYPMLDDRTGSTRAVPPHIGTYVWDAKANVFGWSSYLGKPAGSAEVPAGAVPSRVQNLAGLPPAWIGVGDLDLFLQEDIDYARRLAEAGVPVELYVVPGAFHAFEFFAPGSRIAKSFVESWSGALRAALGVQDAATQ